LTRLFIGFVQSTTYPDISAASRAKFRTWYVSNEHNIDRQYLDPLTGWPYNEFGYDNLDRLTGVTYFDTLVDAFAMDDLGN